MHLELDSDVAKLADYMQVNFEAASLVSIAKAVSLLAPAIWGRHDNGRAIDPVLLISPVETAPIVSSRLAEPSDVDGGSEAEKDRLCCCGQNSQPNQSDSIPLRRSFIP